VTQPLQMREKRVKEAFKARSNGETKSVSHSRLSPTNSKPSRSGRRGKTDRKGEKKKLRALWSRGCRRMSRK